MNLRQILNNSKISLLNKLNYVKTKSNPSKYVKTFDNNRLLRQVLFRNVFPKKLNNIKVNEPFQFTNNFTSEFHWIAAKVLAHSSQINEFIKLKEEFEISLLKNEYEKAKSILDEITFTLGHSLWSIESELHLAEEELGSNENWQKLSDFLKNIQNPFYEFCINASSKKIEYSISFESYVNQVQNDIDTINANALVKDFFVFNNFKLANYNYDFSDLKSVVYISNLFSLIDQYNTLIDVIIFNLGLKENQNNHLFKSFIGKLIKKGNSDSRVINIYNYLSQDTFLENRNWSYINKILESYYDGDFNLAREQSKSFISDYPLEFEIYEIYIKSLINLNKSFEPLGIKSTDSILIELFNFLQFKKESEKHGRKLVKYALKYSSSKLGFQIMDFLTSVDNNKADSLRYSFYSNTYKVSLEKNKNGFSNDLEQYFSRYNFYGYKKVLENVFGFDYKGVVTSSELININVEVTHLYNNEHFNEVISLIENKYSVCTSINYYKERFVFILFNSYLKENDLDKALNLFGEILFDETTFYLKINFKELYDHTFKEEKISHIENVNSLVLASLYRSEYNLYEVLDEFLCSQKCNINDLLNYEGLKQKVFIYLLHKICTIDTIKYYFGRINDAEEFRLKILSHLKVIDEVNKKTYTEEIDEINKKISVRNVIKEVNNGRLFVDIDKLKEQLIVKYHDDFNRLLRIAGEKKNNNLVGFNASKPRNWEASLKEHIKDDSSSYNEADFIAFKNIYYDVREQFLFSKEYGLDSSLSTRIRHGALENQIRSVFENLNLVTTKLSGEYIDSEYWNSQDIKNESLTTIQSQIKIFSKSIDDFTSELKNNAIQITHERIKNRYALFNYSTNDETLYNFYNQHIEYLKSTNDIVEILLNDLSFYTNANICLIISRYLENEVYNLINGFVGKFINSLPSTLPKNIMLFDNLNKSLTNLQLCLEDISEWFVLETSSTSKLLMLEDIINASIEITKQLNTNIIVDYDLDMNFKEVSGYSSLIYVFNILFTNAIIHSRTESKIKLIVNSELIDNKYVKIDVVNTHNIKNLRKTRENLENVKENWNDFKKIERSNIEGESGFHKIKRIMIYEAKCITDKFDFEITNERITISLFLIYKKPMNNEDINN